MHITMSDEQGENLEDENLDEELDEVPNEAPAV